MFWTQLPWKIIKQIRDGPHQTSSIELPTFERETQIFICVSNCSIYLLNVIII